LSVVQSAMVTFQFGWWHCTISTECAIHSRQPSSAFGSALFGADFSLNAISGSMRGCTSPSRGTVARSLSALIKVRS
jgi:hypothetical protein